MKKVLTIFLFFFAQLILGQDYSNVDSKIVNYPSTFKNIENLAHRINTDFKSDREKARALYGWLSLNISYDNQNDSFNISDNIIIYYSLDDKKRKLRKRKLNKLEGVLKSQKAVCIDYSEVFNEVCNLIGIESKIVVGFSKTNIVDIENEKKYKDHAWNAVKINDKWQLLDVTWGASFTNKSSKKIYNYYFFTSPKELIVSHFPINHKWQLLENKISKKEFFKSPLFYPDYFMSKIEIENPHLGTIKVTKKRIKIYFNKIPEKRVISYAFTGDEYARPIDFKTTKEGKLFTSIGYKKSQDTQIIIYSDLVPVIGFRVMLNQYD